MPPAVGRCAITATVVVIALVGLPGAALAHGIGGTPESVWGFVPLGIEHMLLGWDHLLFIAGTVLLAGELRRAATLISVFVAGHSTTLIIATVAGWRVDATAVDVIIALSVVFVGVIGVLGRPPRWWWFTAAVLTFGLVHGLGLSTRLQDLRLPENGLVARVIAFNVGIEIGQLLAIVVLVVLGTLFTKLITWSKAPRLAFGGLVAAGLVAAVILAVVTPTASNADQVEAFGSCTVRPNTQTYGGEGDHPGKDFFEPDEESPPEVDFDHLVGDGYVTVRYSPALPAPQLAQLREFVTGPEGRRVVAGAVTGQTDVLNATHAYKTITCQEFDVIALKNFTKAWFADPRSRTRG